MTAFPSIHLTTLENRMYRVARNLLPLAPFLCWPTPAQEPAGAVPANPYMPLSRDAAWDYRVVQTDGDDKSESRQDWRAWGATKAHDGESVFQVFSRMGDRAEWQYWSARPDGIYRYHNGYIGGRRGHVSRQSPQKLLPTPVGIETEWRWQEQMPVQTMAGAPPPDPERLRIDFRAELVDPSEEVTVPAGTFRAAHVRIEAEYAWFDRVTRRDLWFAPEVGLVKDVQTGGEGSKTQELLAFRPGRGEPPDPAAVLEAHLAEMAAGDEGIRIRIDDSGSYAGYLHSRFARVEGLAEQVVLYRILGRDVVPFAIGKKADWTRLIHDERIADFEGLGDDMPFAEMAEVAARLEAFRLGYREIRRGGTRHSIEGAAGRDDPAHEAEATVTAVDCEGVKHELVATMHMQSGKLTRDPAVVNRP